MKKYMRVLRSICWALGSLSLSAVHALTIRDEPHAIIISTEYFATVTIDKKTGVINQIIPRALLGKNELELVLPFAYNSGFCFVKNETHTAPAENYSTHTITRQTPKLVMIVLKGVTQEHNVAFSKTFMISDTAPVITVKHSIDETIRKVGSSKIYKQVGLSINTAPPLGAYKIGVLDLTGFLRHFYQIKINPEFVQGTQNELSPLAYVLRTLPPIQGATEVKQDGRIGVKALSLGAMSKYFLSYYDERSASVTPNTAPKTTTTYQQYPTFHRALRMTPLSESGSPDFTVSLYCGTKKHQDLVYLKQANNFHQKIAADRGFPFGWSYRLAQWCLSKLVFLCRHLMLAAILLFVMLKFVLVKIQAYFNSPFFVKMTEMQKSRDAQVITDAQFNDQRQKLFLAYGLQAKLMPLYFLGIILYFMLTIGMLVFLQNDPAVYGVSFLWLKNIASYDPYLILPIILLIQHSWYAQKNLQGYYFYLYLCISALITPTLSAASLIVVILGLLERGYTNLRPMASQRIFVDE